MKKIISLVLIASILLLCTGNVLAASVTGSVYTDHTKEEMEEILDNAGVNDVSPNDWYAQGVSTLLEAGLMAPDSKGNINPNDNSNMGDAIALIAKAAGVAGKNDSAEVALQKAKNAGLAESGVVAGSNMTRLDAAKIIAKAFNIGYYSIYNKNLFPFEDFFSFTANERGMIKSLYEKGLIKGYAIGGGKYEFRPEKTITTGELATLVARLLAAK